ncbi:MAG: phage resistance protein [Planctomycetes bacterium]|nr:phage resistance protein [Planctomycetota bacterium]
MTLIKDLIEIPDHVQKGDFVLHLAEDIGRPEVVLKNYVVTPELKVCYDDALAFVRSAVQGNTSKAAYLHGSFGSGKSHFMAVLHLILQGNAAARGIPELAPVIQKHNDWIAGKKFLLVPYHMIGAHDMESGILGGYVEYIRRVHPEAPIPGVYLAEGLFRDAQSLRATLGDAKFFEKLNEGGGSGGGWGALAANWDAARFDTAVEAPPGAEERSQLISTLIAKFFGSYDTQAGGRGEAFISLDKGLSVISQHAASLGYHALILFLDELVLWLASHAADLKFVHQEGQKLAKLVEAQTPDRPVPVVSFVARQRDLRELIGDAVPGADRLNFGDALKHWEGRFHKITLEDRNLPLIAEKRVLKCKSESARQELDAAFEQTIKMRDSAMNVLLTAEGDRQMFRRVYPFSPALVQTLIAVSSVLQRERTALKVMMQLLVEQRETLKVGDIVPIGDLFDTIAHGDEAFSQEMALHFDNAKRLYHQKLLPLLERQHGIRREDVEQLPYEDPKRIAFRNDDRLIKTLLLGALVPEVESLRSLNAERLAALNHGTIRTPIAGREGQEVLRRCRAWAASVGEIRIGEETNPTISVQLSGVDTEGIIAQASREDNQGNRIRRVRQILFEQVGIEGEGEFEQYHEFLWRNTKRSCVVLFKNIRELPDASLESNEDAWKLIIDFPFDEPGHGPMDDLSRLQKFRQTQPQGAKTVCWVPAFLSNEAQKDLGMLVILEHILSGERFTQYSNHLSPQDRQSAKSVLENQRSVLRERVKSHLDAAYGLEAITPGALDTTHELELAERYVSLFSGFDPQPPVAANLGQAMQHLIGQALIHEFPAAPNFETEIKSGNLKKVYEQVALATQAPDGRVEVDKTLRPLLRQIANPLLVGEMRLDATHFVLGRHWRSHFGRKAAETGSPMTVENLRKWIDDPRPMGLPKEAQNLVLLVFAAQTNRTFYLHGVHYDEPTLANIPDKCELREQKLPDAGTWEKAVQRAGSIFGVAVSRLLNASNVGLLSAGVKAKAGEVRRPCQRYVQRLRERLTRIGVVPEEADRMLTASTTQGLVERICGDEAIDLVNLLATANVATSEAAMGECVGKAAELEGNLDTGGWEIFEAVGALTDDRQAEAREVVVAVRDALRSDEHVMQLAPALRGAQAKAVRLLSKPTQAQPPTGPAPVVPPAGPTIVAPVVPDNTRKIVSQGAEQGLELPAAKELLAKLDRDKRAGQAVRVNLSWIIEEGGKST